MNKQSVVTIIEALNTAQVRYLIAGGLAVVAHGYLRLTHFVDVILDLRDGNVRSAIAALSGLGFRPLVPVPLDDFADAAKRLQWVREKNLTVFSLFSANHPETAIDLFVEAPLDFDQAYAAAVSMELAAGVHAKVIGLDDLLEMKRQAGRPLDLIDIGKLTVIKESRDYA